MAARCRPGRHPSQAAAAVVAAHGTRKPQCAHSLNPRSMQVHTTSSTNVAASAGLERSATAVSSAPSAQVSTASGGLPSMWYICAISMIDAPNTAMPPSRAAWAKALSWRWNR